MVDHPYRTAAAEPEVNEPATVEKIDAVISFLEACGTLGNGMNPLCIAYTTVNPPAGVSCPLGCVMLEISCSSGWGTVRMYCNKERMHLTWRQGRRIRHVLNSAMRAREEATRHAGLNAAYLTVIRDKK